ncbi:hypothetical protein [Pseudomonas sp. IT-P218]|jgi:hypothetical protein|uniref:hypothetical protein n=1 Tax=Pseudomonas sp. IT-P218 TaxID=3026449 RepID=UPI000F9243ED
MANPAPTLNIKVSGSPLKATITLAKFKGPLCLCIPNIAKLYPEGIVYAIIGDPEDPELKGADIAAGEWVPSSPDAEPEDGEYQQSQDLEVELSLAQLQWFKGRIVELRYQGTGESSLTTDSDPILLTII